MCVHVVGGVRVRVGARARCVYAVRRGRLGTRLPAAGAGRLGNTANTHVPYRVAVCTRLICPTHRCRVRARARPRARPRVSCFTDYSWLHILMHAS